MEELRAAAPRSRSATWLARRLGVSPRTVGRDLAELQRDGVPVRFEPGRLGGYSLDRDHPLDPLSLTLSEALALTVALRSLDDSPFAVAGRSAGAKLLAVLPSGIRRQESALVERIDELGEPAGESARRPGAPAESPAGDPAVGGLAVEAVERGQVLHLTYRDRSGAVTERDVEPFSVLRTSRGWTLIAYDRLGSGLRGFLLDRIRAAELRDERVPERDDDTLRKELARWDAGPLTSHDRWH